MEGKPDVSSNDIESDVVFDHGKMLGVSNLGTELEEKMLFVCAQCKVLFDSQESCTRHMREHHNLLDFNFSDIQLTDGPRRTRGKINRSLSTSSPESGALTPKKVHIPSENHLYRCPQCPYMFETLEVFQFHEASHADRDTTQTNRFVCRICQGQHESDKRLGISRNSSAQPGISESEPANNSDLPQFYYESWGKCSWHLWKQHKIDCELPSCLHPLCDFKTLFLQKVREHEAVHSPVRHFRCDICHKTFKQLKQLRTHEKYHRTKNTNLPPPTESRWYTTQKCDICSRVLSDSKCLKKHIAVVHNKLKPHTCNVCGHQSARKAELQLHLRTHTREKPHKCPCPTCPYATGDHNSLRRHVLTHSSKQKPYSCPLCPFTCIQSAGFKKHVIARHAADEAMNSLFVCPYCPHISVSKSVHEYHIQDHDQGRIPIQDMQQTAEARNSSGDASSSRAERPFLAHEDSSSNSVDFGTRNSSYWNREDDSSVDMVVDTGGITIPATQPQPTTSPSPILLK